MSTKTSDRKRERIEARVNADTKNLIIRAAEIQGLSISDFMVQAAFESAKSVIETQSVIRLSATEAERFIEATDNAPAPGPILSDSLRKYRRFFEERE